ncbi:hypothetical protein QZH41_003437 [Actinostola sp. cb2023]|nr:hypothetical protein QZH41_003437 [Actinostola sp. cb2023]
MAKGNMKEAEEEEGCDLKSLFELVKRMNKKLDKLESIEAHLQHVDRDIADLKYSLTFAHDTTDEITKKQATHDGLFTELNVKVSYLEKQTSNLKDDLVDLRARNMRNNLLFYNLPEEEEENPETIVSDVLIKMGMMDAGYNQTMEIERAHRIGRRKPDTTRPIVVKFLRFQDKELIRKNAFKLKGTKIGISEQFPKEIADERKKLYPVMKEAKQKGSKAVMVKDKLYINGQRYFPTQR